MIRIKTSLVVALLATGLLWSSAAGAARLALVDLDFFSEGFAGATPGVCCVASAMGVWATVGSTPGTPYVKWPASHIAELSATRMIGGTFGPSGTPNPSTVYGGGYFSFNAVDNRFNEAASLMAENLAPGTGTVGAGTTALMNAHVQDWPATTTICNNSCAPKVGQIAQAVGSRQFGGTARLLTNTVESGIVKIATGSYGNLDIVIQSTAMLAAAPQLSQFGQAASSTFVTTMGGASNGGVVHELRGPTTTGTVRAIQPSGMLATDFTRMGTHNLNQTNLTGMISVVSPRISQNWSTFGGFVTGPGGQSFGRVNQVQVTFLPEPGFALALGIGVMGFAALHKRRKG